MLRTGRIPLSTMRYYTGFAPGFQRGMRKITNLRPPAQRKRRIFVRIYNGRRKTQSGDMDLHCQELGKLIGRAHKVSRPIREAMCVIGGLSYPSCPRCRGHAHRLPAASGAMDQTVRTAIEGEKPLRCKERRGRRSQVDSCTRLALDAVGTPTGCRLRREPWIRLSGRPSRGGGHCGARGQGRG